jgi:glycosyltransferase involved in cell wall biosynthesis
MTPDLALLILGVVSLGCAAVPALLFAENLRLYRRAPMSPLSHSDLSVSVLIPARDEEAVIGPTVESVLANQGIEFEVIVLDDHSRDATARIVDEIARHDPRARVVTAPPLPSGWSGKQHACWRLSELARYPLLLFLDADVRLAPDALARSVSFLRASGADLVSGIPHQETGGLLEKLVIPLIHFILLEFLPMGRMRRTTATAYAAGCGQFFLTRRDSYLKSGGHAEIRSTFHDGLRLPRAFRAAGLKTDLFDPTDLAACRMYRDPISLWNGLSKNAGEGLASPRLIVPMTLILAAGQILPIPLLIIALASPTLNDRALLLALGVAATLTSYLPRFLMASRFRQSWLGACLHPVGILILLAIQWYSWFRNLLGMREVWKGRRAPATPLDSAIDCTAPTFFETNEPNDGSDRTVKNSAWG